MGRYDILLEQAQQPPSQHIKTKPLPPADPPVPEKPARPNGRPVERPNGKRIITRNSFEIYEDQMDALRKLSYQEKMAGGMGSMSAMVRDAIDTYLKKNTAEK